MWLKLKKTGCTKRWKREKACYGGYVGSCKGSSSNNTRVSSLTSFDPLFYASVTLVITLTLSQFAHLSSSFIPGRSHISNFCVPKFVWYMYVFICASICVLVCRSRGWLAPLICSLRKQRDECWCLACFVLFNLGSFSWCFQSHSEGIFFLCLNRPGNNALKYIQTYFYDGSTLSQVDSEDKTITAVYYDLPGGFESTDAWCNHM